MDWGDSGGWFLLGLVGQTAFFSRFLVQWLASERAGQSVIPIAFWYLSLAGSALLLFYAIHRQEPIFLLGQTLGGFVYARNLVLIRRDTDAAQSSKGV